MNANLQLWAPPPNIPNNHSCGQTQARCENAWVWKDDLCFGSDKSAYCWSLKCDQKCHGQPQAKAHRPWCMQLCLFFHIIKLHKTQYICLAEERHIEHGIKLFTGFELDSAFAWPLLMFYSNCDPSCVTGSNQTLKWCTLSIPLLGKVLFLSKCIYIHTDIQRHVALFVLTLIFVCSSKRWNPLQVIFIFHKQALSFHFLCMYLHYRKRGNISHCLAGYVAFL